MTGCGRAPSLADDSTLSEDERAMLHRARPIVPRLAERAPAATAARRLPAQTIAEYRDAGILHILQPRRFGGLQGRFILFSRARACLWVPLAACRAHHVQLVDIIFIY